MSNLLTNEIKKNDELRNNNIEYRLEIERLRNMLSNKISDESRKY